MTLTGALFLLILFANTLAVLWIGLRYRQVTRQTRDLRAEVYEALELLNQPLRI